MLIDVYSRSPQTRRASVPDIFINIDDHLEIIPEFIPSIIKL